jgi:hypothetical protein
VILSRPFVDDFDVGFMLAERLASSEADGEIRKQDAAMPYASRGIRRLIESANIGLYHCPAPTASVLGLWRLISIAES